MSLLQRDEGGPFLLLAFEELDEARARLALAGIEFAEEEPTTCGGPVFGLLRFDEAVDEGEVCEALGLDR